MKYQIILTMCIALGLIGCVNSTGPTPTNLTLEGETKADETLANDTIDAITKHVATKNCTEISKIEAKVLKVHSMQPKKYKIQEQWSASGCGQIFVYDVLFTPNGSGGSTYTLKPL